VLSTGYVFSIQGDRLLPWITLALHGAITAVIAPITLRRYPCVR
jgi:hypothetical protein